MSKNVSSLAGRLGLKNGLYQRQMQSDLSPDSIKSIADEALIGTAVIESSHSFYDVMSGDNANKRAYVCNGTACLCAGGQEQLTETLQQHLGADQVGQMTCLGHCYQAGAFMLDGKTYDQRHHDQLATLNQNTNDPLTEIGKSLNEPVLLISCDQIKDWYEPIIAACQNNQTDRLLQQILDANLRGRGGAGFPAGIKWQSCQAQDSEVKYIVCNADEGDPGAFSDRYLLEHHPHSVLFGMMLAGVITGAREGVLYLRAEYPYAVDICQRAIHELRAAKLFGAPLNEQGVSFDVHLFVGSGAYICGEETALLRSIEGQRPLVSVRPPFPVESGLFGKPTVVNNVETFACCHWIVEHGGAAFARLGTKQSAGVKCVSLDHTFNNPGIYEVPMGVPLAQIIELGGGFKTPVKALHIGGPLGGVVPMSEVDKLTLSFESFAQQGFLLGHASILGIPQSMPMLEYIKHLFEFTAHESCGKCFPCRLGATRGKEMMQAAVNGNPLDAELLNDLLETMELGSLCALGGGVPLPVKNIIQYFPQELFVNDAVEVSHD